MNLNYIRMNPSGNITLLVTDPVPRKDQSEVARRLMQMDPGVEQVGFLEKACVPGARARLQMMGGEFCGNATMSLAAYLALRENLPEGEERIYPLEVSGADQVIPCRIVRDGEKCRGTVPMPLPREIVSAEILPGVQVPLVRFDGIGHAIIARNEITPEQAEARISALCAEWNTDALGILFADDQAWALRPLVYVASTGSAVWENSCGSGTAAIGAWQADLQKGKVQLKIAQPCPDTCIAVQAQCGGARISKLEITGTVRLEAYLSAQM